MSTTFLSKFASSSTLASFTSSYQKLSENPSVQGIQTEASKRLALLKGWGDFFALSRFQRPTDYASFKKRFDFNIAYFQNNYILVSFIVVAWFLISNILLLLGAGLGLVAGKYIQSLPSNQPISIFGTPFLPAQLWIMYSFAFVLWFWLSGVTGTLMYCVGFCAVLVAAHAGSLEKPIEAEFASESEFTEVA